MYVVAVSEVPGDAESEAYALAPLVGLSPYDVRLRLSAVLPRIVFQSNDRDDALRVLSALRERGLGAVACDTTAMRKGRELVKLHRFAWDAEALIASDGVGAPRLAWTDIGVVISVMARTDVLREKEEIDYELRGRGAQRVERVVTTHESTMELSAFIFPKKGDAATAPAPWVLHERDAQFLSLGPRMQPTRRANFHTTIALFREQARGAVFDERYVKSPLTSTDFVHVTGTSEARTDAAPRGVEVQAVLLSLWLERSQGGPYRSR